MKNLPFWGQALIFAIIGAILIFVGYKTPPANLSQRAQAIQTLEEENRRLESEVRIAEGAAAKRKELEAEIARLDAELLALRAMLRVLPPVSHAHRPLLLIARRHHRAPTLPLGPMRELEATVRRSLESERARPRSASFDAAHTGRPRSYGMRMLAGLMSRWITPALCAAARPLVPAMQMSSASASEGSGAGGSSATCVQL